MPTCRSWKTGLEIWKWRPYKVRSLVSNFIYAKKDRNGPPSANQVASKDEHRNGHAVSTLQVHPPTSPCPALSAHAESKSQDIMKLKVSWQIYPLWALELIKRSKRTLSWATNVKQSTYFLRYRVATFLSFEPPSPSDQELWQGAIKWSRTIFTNQGSWRAIKPGTELVRQKQNKTVEWNQTGSHTQYAMPQRLLANQLLLYKKAGVTYLTNLSPG